MRLIMSFIVDAGIDQADEEAYLNAFRRCLLGGPP